MILAADQSLEQKVDTPLQPFRLQRDLAPLADLVELAFKDELERTGNPIVAEMRRLARLGPLLWLAGGSESLLPPFLDGYVWIVDGRLVGNASLTRESGAPGVMSVSNVAVLPAYRHQGIARRLMEAVIRRAVERGAKRLLLEVNDDNVAARQLYESLGFELYDTCHEVRMPRFRWPEPSRAPNVPLRPWRAADAAAVRALIRAATPEEMQGLPMGQGRRPVASDSRLLAWLSRLFGQGVRRTWVLEGSASLQAALQVIERDQRDAHRLDIVVRPQHRGTLERELLSRALYELRRRQLDLKATVSASHPQALQAFKEAGFDTVRVLARMTLDLRPTTHGVVI